MSALLAAPNLKIKEMVMTDIIEPRDPPGFAGDARVTKVKADVAEQSAIDALFQGRQYTAIAAFHGLMSVHLSLVRWCPNRTC